MRQLLSEAFVCKNSRLRGTALRLRLKTHGMKCTSRPQAISTSADLTVPGAKGQGHAARLLAPEHPCTQPIRLQLCTWLVQSARDLEEMEREIALQEHAQAEPQGSQASNSSEITEVQAIEWQGNRGRRVQKTGARCCKSDSRSQGRNGKSLHVETRRAGRSRS